MSKHAELNLIRHLLVLLGAHPILHISRIRVNSSVAVFWGGATTMAAVTNYELK